MATVLQAMSSAAPEQSGTRWDIQRWGGAAALAFAAYLLATFGVILFYFPTQGFSVADYSNPEKALAFTRGHAILYIAISVLGPVLSGSLLATVGAVRRRLGTTSELGAIAVVFGIVGATASMVFWVVDAASVSLAFADPVTSLRDQPIGAALHDILLGPFLTLGMCGFALFTGIAALRGGSLPRWFGIVSIVCAVGISLDLFGLPVGQLAGAIWLVSLGAVLIRRPSPA
jgi:hypothetical protein